MQNRLTLAGTLTVDGATLSLETHNDKAELGWLVAEHFQGEGIAWTERQPFTLPVRITLQPLTS
jgi:hypothetical protein